MVVLPLSCLGLSENKLTLDDLGKVMEEILDVSVQWYHLGVQLKVRTGTLDNIQAQYSDPKRQLLEVLKVWLTISDSTTWNSLTDALKSRSVGVSQLAAVLEKKYCLSEETKVDIGNSTSAIHPEIVLNSCPPVSEQIVSVQQPAVGPIQESKLRVNN